MACLTMAGIALADPATPTGVIITSITAGRIDPALKVPVFDGVPGAQVDNADLSMPQAILVHGQQYSFVLTSQNTTFTGTCKDSYRLTQVQSGKTVVLQSATIVKSYDCTPGTYWMYYYYGKPIPNSPGPATLIGTVTYGTNKISMTTHVVIQ
ncbi:MAG TPA: hypothetical protein VK779_10935 [Rhizomicrobium sp.]|nr:hypothetical protein [Rhizomicrobium sp.]